MSSTGNTAKRWWIATGAVAAAIAVVALAVAAGVATAAPVAAAPVTAAPAAGGVASPQATVTAAPATASHLGLATGSIIVVRRVGTQDSLWSVSPVPTSALKLIDLPFRPARLLASPDNTKIAILPAAVGGKVYIFNLSLAKLAPLSFASQGVKQIDGMTWLSATRLLVSGSGSTKETVYPLADKLYAATTTSGKPAAFRRLKGTEPSATPAGKLLVYVRMRDGGPVSGNPGARFVVESLVRLKLVSGSTPHVIARARYTNDLDIRRFHDPGVSPDAKYVVTSTTGSDVSVSYMVRKAATGATVHKQNLTLAGRDETAWSHAGDKVAFWGVPPIGPMTNTYLYVYDTGAKKLKHGKPIPNMGVTGIAWAPDDSLIAYALHSPGQADDRAHLWTAVPGASSTPTDLGAGSLPVWLP
jgi:hypothetical protein